MLAFAILDTAATSLAAQVLEVPTAGDADRHCDGPRTAAAVALDRWREAAESQLGAADEARL